jgi:hypothetical protein
MDLQFGQKVVISEECPHHGGKSGLFQFTAEVAKETVAIIQDSKTNRQFKTKLEYVVVPNRK